MNRAQKQDWERHMRDMYETDQYAEQNPTWHEEDAAWKAAHIERMLRRSGAATSTICEVGCGTGDILLNLEQKFPEATLSGYEISAPAFRRAKQKETTRTKFFHSDLTKDESLHFDALLVIDVFEHVEDYLSFVTSLRGKADLKIFHIPLDLSVQSLVRSHPIMTLRQGVGHIHYFYKETALATLRDCGYSILDYTYTASRLELPNQALSSRLMKLPRRVAFAVNRDLAVRVLGGYSLLVLAR